MPVQPVVEYESPDALDGVAFVGGMRWWRRVAGWGFWLSIAGLILYAPLMLVAVAVLCVGSVGALACMACAAGREVGVGYAVRHLVLAIVLMPVLFLGVFLVTRLVEGDLVNWRLAERRAA